MNITNGIDSIVFNETPYFIDAFNSDIITNDISKFSKQYNQIIVLLPPFKNYIHQINDYFKRFNSILISQQNITKKSDVFNVLSFFEEMNNIPPKIVILE